MSSFAKKKPVINPTKSTIPTKGKVTIVPPKGKAVSTLVPVVDDEVSDDSQSVDKEEISNDVSVNDTSSNSDIEIEFDDVPTVPTRADNVYSEDGTLSAKVPSKSTSIIDNDDLDIVMLKHIANNSSDADEDETTKKIIGTKARFNTLMKETPNIDDAEEENDSNEGYNVSHEETKRTSKSATKSRPKKNTKISATKKGPGRPRKTPKKEPIPRKGIAKSPINTDSFIEVLYDKPIVMKKIFQFFKAIAADQIQIIFRPKDIIFYAVDHLEKSKIRVRFDTSKLNSYYCRDILDIGISTKEMDLILNKVDKEYSSIVILSDVGSTQRNITLVLENEIQIDEMHRLELISNHKKMEDESLFTDENYTIKFEFPSKYFKKTVSDIKTMSVNLSITQEDTDSPIVFEYLTDNKRIQSKHTIKDGKKIKLESNLAPDRSFRVDVRIDYLKPISSSQISDEIRILVDENKDFMTVAYIDDGTIEIKTLTEIIDERPEEDD
jgi:hypothetical protein